MGEYRDIETLVCWAAWQAGQDAQRESDVNKNTSKARTSPSTTPPTMIQADAV